MINSGFIGHYVDDPQFVQSWAAFNQDSIEGFLIHRLFGLGGVSEIAKFGPFRIFTLCGTPSNNE